jgi:hypothetical protein
MHRRSLAAVLLCALAAAAACGRKGPPLPPLRPMPGPVTAVAARRLGDHIELHFAIPTTNTDRTSPAAVARVEIYARSVPADSPRPVQEQIVLKENLVDTIEVKPPASDKNPPAPTAPVDTRPATGDAVTFRETLPTTAPTPLPALKGRAAIAAAASQRGAGAAPPPAGPPGQGVIPSRSPESRSGGAGAAGTTGAAVATGAAATAAAGVGATGAATAGAPETQKVPAMPPKPLPPTRYFWIRAVSSHGQPGANAELVAVALAAPPAPPSNANITYDEKTLTFTWTPAADGQTFRVYEIDRDGNEKNKDGHPLNDAPLKTPEFKAPVEFDHERCLAVRAVDMTGNAAVESDPARVCKTPKDTFPPAVPANLNGLPDAGTVALRWDPVTASDLAGYIVLRGEGTGDTLQQLTASPVAATTYVDSAVRPGVTYVYVVVAVDLSANRSEHSNTYTVTIR